MPLRMPFVGWVWMGLLMVCIHGRVLLQHADMTRDHAPGPLADGTFLEQDIAADRGGQAGQAAQQGGFSRAVRAQ